MSNSYEIESTSEDSFDKAQKKYRESQWNQEEGEW